MQFKKKAITSAIVSAIIAIGSLIAPLVPCKISPLIPNPNSQWKMCSLNPDLINPLGPVKEFFGYTTSFTESFFSVIIISFLVSFALLHFTSRKK